MSVWGWVGIVLSIAVVCGFLWWHARKSKSMADKPKPK